jgi:serine/threonine protein kinase
VWAIGITMYEVITLHNPFENKSDDQVKRLLLRDDYPVILDEEGFYDAEMIKLINSMLSVYHFFYIYIFLLTTINFDSGLTNDQKLKIFYPIII